MMGTLYVVATPIGNLKDVSTRALDVLTSVELVFAEDTRVTKKLLSRYNIKTVVKRYNEHSSERAVSEVVSVLLDGGSVALVSDAGTPGISDPGAVLVSSVREKIPEVKIVAIPGPSAVIAALSVSGIPANKFTFLGYPPAKRKRKAFFERVRDVSARPVVFYESPHRFQKTLTELSGVVGQDVNVFVVKELTKIYETHFAGTIREAQAFFTGERARGEFVIVVP